MKEKELIKLLLAATTWNTEDYKYIAMSWRGVVFFSNELDCNGDRYWRKEALYKFVERQLKLGE